MKKNEAMGYVAYLLMLAIALLVALLVVRPVFSNSDYFAALPMNSFLFIIIAVAVGVLLNALFIELGHLIGAKMGHYKVTSWICLGLGWKLGKDGKKHATISSFDGLTGETKVVPLDEKKSNPRHMIYMPLLFLLLEVVGLSAEVAICRAKGDVNNVGSDPHIMAWAVFGIIILAVAGMIYVYDIFPAPLDAKNDGYLLTILTNETNKEAYNQILIAEDKMANGLPVGDTPVYDSVTNFTSRVNDVTLYQRLGQGNYEGALAILEKTIACKDKVSENIYEEAITQKTALYLMARPFEEAKQFYIDLPLADKKHLASLSTSADVRAYVLVSGLVDESENEVKEALNHSYSALKKSGVDKKPIELTLLNRSIDLVHQKHPEWDFSDYDEVLHPEKAKEEAAKEAAPEKKDEEKKEEPTPEKPVETKPEEMPKEDEKK
jgi:hypothetical protein